MKNPSSSADGFAKWLRDENACAPARGWSAGKDLRTIWETCPRGDWLEWLLDRCGYQWTAPAWAEYQRVRAPALAEYQRVTADSIRAVIPYPFKD